MVSTSTVVSNCCVWLYTSYYSRHLCVVPQLPRLPLVIPSTTCDIPRTNDARAIIEIECRITTNAVSLTVNTYWTYKNLKNFLYFLYLYMYVFSTDLSVFSFFHSLANRKGGSELSIRSDGFSSIESNLAADSPTCHNLAQPRLSLSLFAPSFPLRLINNEKEKKSARGGFAAINTRPLASQPVSSFFDSSIYNSDDCFGTMQKSQITTF